MTNANEILATTRRQLAAARNECVICADQGKWTPATALCNELKRPVCSEHARYCVEEQHGASPLESAHPIPPITDPMGTHWEQPPREEILIDDTHAIMSASAFKALHEYSASMPSGVYPGKMWKRHNGIYDADFLRRGGAPEWKLGWYGLSEKGEGFCSIHFRTILIV